MRFRNKLTGQLQEVGFDIAFDAEGIWSAARTSLLLHPYINYAQHYLDYDYKELTIPAVGGAYALPKEALHLWPRGAHLMIALPNPDGSFTCTLFLPHRGEVSFDSLQTPDKVQAFFRREFPDAVDLIEHLEEHFLHHPVGKLATVKISPWTFDDKFLLIGDAAHAIIPFYGQGLNCGFEDCSVAEPVHRITSRNWPAIFASYEQMRHLNTDAVAELSQDNFVELRANVADPVFRRKRELETLLEKRILESSLQNMQW